jgi:hypothetical protein
MRWRLVGLLATLGAAAHAQDSTDAAISLEALGGYAFVNVDRWAAFVPQKSDQRTYGLHLRATFVRFEKFRVGFELGRRHHFNYERAQIFQGIRLRVIHTIASTYVGVMTTYRSSSTTVLSGGGGFHYFGDRSLPGVNLGIERHLLDGTRFSWPVGIRMDYIPELYTTLIPFTIKSGLALKL